LELDILSALDILSRGLDQGKGLSPWEVLYKAIWYQEETERLLVIPPSPGTWITPVPEGELKLFVHGQILVPHNCGPTPPHSTHIFKYPGVHCFSADTSNSAQWYDLHVYTCVFISHFGTMCVSLCMHLWSSLAPLWNPGLG
jgi:hypothetical protein